MKNKKISIIFLVGGLILLIAGIILVVLQIQKKSDNYVVEETKYTIEDLNVISICDTENCPTMPVVLLHDINYKTDNVELREGIDKINAQTHDYYEMINASDTSNPSCEQYQGIIKHDTLVGEHFYIYTKGRYDSIGISRYLYNICDDIYEYQQVEVYVYDKKEDEVLTQEEFKNALNLTNTEIEAKINEDLLSPNEGLDASVTIDDVDFNDLVLFYDFNGDLCVSYKITKDNTYRVTVLKENEENLSAK